MSSDKSISQNADRCNPEGTSELVYRILNELDNSTTSVGYLLSQLDQRSFGGIIVCLSVIGLLPGVSVLAGLCILVLAVQIIAGKHVPRMPVFLSRRELSVDNLRKMMHKPLRYITQMEKLIKPRYPLFLSPLATRLTGLVILGLALIMISPLPLSNLLPAIALLLISLGLLESDGLAILAGWVFSIVALIVGVLMILAAVELTSWVLTR